MALDIDWVRSRLPGRRVAYVDVTESTMQDAGRLADAGCPSGTLVVAEQQVAGQGRLGRRWESERGAGLYTSLVLRLPYPADHVPALALALGLATAEAVARTADLACDLRWPNDLLLNGRKCAGILVQLNGDVFVAGIGINVNQAKFPPELEPIATSLRIESGLEQSRERLLVALAGAADSFSKMLVEGGRDAVLKAFARTSSYVKGKRVVVDMGDRTIEGTTDGLDEAGFLFVKADDGTRRLVLAGGVRPAGES